MPSHEIALPAGSKNLNPALPTTTRYSKDGDIPVVRLFGGDNFVGDVLEGSWLKGNDGLIVGPYTAIISSGQLELTGKSHVAGTVDFGWINGQDPFIMLQDSYIDVHLKVPSVTPSHEIFAYFHLRAEQATNNPYIDDNHLRLTMKVTTAPLVQIRVEKWVNNSSTTLYVYTTVTNNEGTFRVKFRPDDDKLDIYFHDGAGDIVESTDELTLTDDTLDLAFIIGYPVLAMGVQETTIRTCISEKVEASYPDFDVKYDLSDEAFQGEGSELLTKAFDTSDSRKDCVIELGSWDRDGKFGKCMQLDCMSTPIEMPSPYTTYDLDSTTFCFWAKRDYLKAEFPGGTPLYVFSYGTTNRFIAFISNGNIQIETNTNADAAVGIYTDDLEWHHYAIVCDSKAITFYEDGSDITTGTPVVVDDITLASIGNAFAGKLDDIRIYNTVLSQSDVQAVIADNAPSAGLIQEYLFDGGNTRGDVVCYDTRGKTDETLWQRVYTEDHEFSGECVIENGLIRMHIREGSQYGLDLYYWDGSWSLPIDIIRLQLASDAKALVYPFFQLVEEIDGAEKIRIRVRICEASDEYSEYNVEADLTLIRGAYHLTFEIVDISLEQNLWFIFGDGVPIRWAYCGDVESKGMGDYDFLLTVSNNVMTDNFMLNFDDALSPVLGYVTTNEKPAAGSAMFHAYQGGYIALSQIAAADLDATKIHCGLVPFRKIANLFTEAEDGTLSGGATANHFEDGFAVDSSGEYEKDTGSFTWDTGNSRLTSTTNAKQILVKALEFGSGTYEFVWTHILGPGSPIGGLIFCSDREAATQGNTPKNGYFVGMNADGGQITLERWLNDSMQQLDAEWFTFTVDVPYKITVVFDSVADTITVDIDDVQKMSTSGATHFNSGAFGIGNNGDCYYDSVAIDAEEVESSGNSAVMLDVQNELVKYELTAITDIPAGRYLAIFRLKSTGQVSNEAAIDVYNSTDSKFINEAGIYELLDLTASYAYYSLVFDIMESDAGDTIRLLVQKSITGSTTVVCDYMLIIPIGDGESFPQDIAHSALRSLTKKPKLVER